MDVIEKHSFLSLAENFIQNKHKGHTHACTQKKKTASSAIRTRKKHKHVTVLHDSTQYTWEQILIAHKNIMHTSGPYSNSQFMYLVLDSCTIAGADRRKRKIETEFYEMEFLLQR